MRARRLLFALSCCAALLAPPASAAGSDSCTCRHLESLQQETANAEYEARFFTDMAGALKAVEDHQRDLNENHPTERGSGDSVHGVSAAARDRMMKDEFRLPHPEVKDYTGPKSVDLENGKCTNRQGDLDGLARGSSCREIGTITLEHEARHRADCEAMGADAYWTRLPSQVAQEEAERYREQATAMRELLKHVLDGAIVEIESLTVPVLEGHGMRVVYRYEMKPARVEGRSSPGADRWKLEGRAQRVGTIESIRLPGMSCTPSGQLNDSVSLSLGLDGFTMDLGMATTAQAGDVKVKCTVPGAGSGFGQSLRPPGDGGSGTVFSGSPVQLETTHVTDFADSPAGQAMSGSGMSVSGEDITRVRITCPAN